MERRRWHCGSFILLLALGLGAAPLVADEPAKNAKPGDEDYELYQIFADTIDQVERNYVKDISRRELMEAAIQGVLGKLDPYSNYISPDDIGRFKSTVESQFGGIGIQIGMENGRLKVMSPLVGTPAYRAGLEAGDLILEIDGHKTDGIQIDEAVKRLKGEAGTKVTLVIQHPNSTKSETLTITREWVHIDTVLGDRRKGDDAWDFMLDRDKRIGYVRISAFSRDTAQDLKKVLVELQNEGLRGLIVDLRFNPGGLLTSAIEVSDLFVADGRIVSTKGRNTPERTWEAEKEGTFEGFPMAVLVNHYSASASEIFSACLQDHKRAVVIGERTWGKGSVQNVIELEGGKSALKLTTASYHRPSGKNIHRFPDSKEGDEWGVRPDAGFELALNRQQTEQLLADRRKRDVVRRRHRDDVDTTAAAVGVDTPAPKTDQPAGEEKPQESTPAEPKPEEPKADQSKPDEAKPSEPPSPEKPAAVKPAEEKPAEAKPAAEKPADHEAAEATDSTGPSFVDPQLQKAIDYLTQEIARAE
jgi:carboxyl-terminal processing protease